MRLLLHQRLGGAAHHAHGRQTADHVDGGGEMTVLPPGAGHAAGDGAFLGGEDDPGEVAVKGGRFADDVGAGHVGDVAVDFAARVGEHELTGARGAVTTEFRLPFTLQRALGHTGPVQAAKFRLAGRGGRRGATQDGGFMGVLRPAGR